MYDLNVMKMFHSPVVGGNFAISTHIILLINKTAFTACKTQQILHFCEAWNFTALFPFINQRRINI